jgi:hypothetical protein
MSRKPPVVLLLFLSLYLDRQDSDRRTKRRIAAFDELVTVDADLGDWLMAGGIISLVRVRSSGVRAARRRRARVVSSFYPYLGKSSSAEVGSGVLASRLAAT